MKNHDSLWINATLTVVTEQGLPETINHAAIACKNGLISYLSSMADLPQSPEQMAERVIDVADACITPGLIDCHTHLIFAGNRAEEFNLRLQGQSYEQIAKQGGGIMSTVKQTRAETEQTLEDSARRRLDQLLADGVTTVEIKSGYGLTTADEMKMLRVARQLGKSSPVTVTTTFLGAHALPPEYRDRRSEYIDLVCNEMLPRLHAEGLIDAVDAFCEGIAFSVEEVESVFAAATALGLPVKLHAEQLSNCGGTELAAKYGALSADHLEYLDEAGAAALARSGGVAVLLPGAFYMLRETQKPPVSLLREHSVPIALATDANPGSSPALSARLMMVMGCQEFGLTPQEALHGMTINAAKALGMADDIGSLQLGKAADLVLWQVKQPSELAYWLGGNLVQSVIKAGESIYPVK
ncbi:MAG: imidazolonepropionase [Proteobacteria bacterium]|jgi:imidazolonepropionase|nr:imidazolonepropionase [Pseudomonadota bacterium]MDA1351153.1 imidazolonepropionase [Pseudomonadota bacterium]